MTDELRLDGNAAAGLLGEIFAFDVTRAHASCDGCGRPSLVAELHLYAAAMGAVLRCPGCSHIMICATAVGGALRLDMRGVSLLTVPSS